MSLIAGQGLATQTKSLAQANEIGLWVGRGPLGSQNPGKAYLDQFRDGGLVAGGIDLGLGEQDLGQVDGRLHQLS